MAQDRNDVKGGARPPLPPIRFEALAQALLAQAATLVPMWLPGGQTKGHEYFAHSLWRDEKTPSLSVRMQGERAGRWSDHGGTHKGGDLLSLYAAIHSLDQGHAAVQLARELGLEDVAGVQRSKPGAQPAPAPPPPVAKLPARPVVDKETWTPCASVPAHAPAPTFWHYEYNSAERQAVVDHRAEYRRDDVLYGFVLRFIKTEGGKEPLPYCWCTSDRDGGSKWHWRQFAEPRPLYLPLHTLAPQTTVVVVEGEKKADILQAALDAGAPGVYTVAAWPGGGKAWNKASWDWLAGRTVLLWPDCDGQRELLSPAERQGLPDKAARMALQATKPLLPPAKQPGMRAMLAIGQHLRDAHGCAMSLLRIPQPGEVEGGWDCADAITTDGWDFARLQAFLSTAYALPPTEPNKAPGREPGGAAGKKIEGLVGTGGGDFGDGGGGDFDPPADDYDRQPGWLMPYWNEKKSYWMVSRKLVIAALTHDALLAPVLGLNQLSNNIEARLDWPFMHGQAGPLKSVDDLRLGAWLSWRYGLPSIPRAALMEGIETVAHARPFHPVREYLATLQWDGVSRIDKWLMYTLGESPETTTPAEAEYFALVGRYWLLGMVYRVMQPGCKFDYCPVLEGAGGLGKSTLVEVLASTAYYSDTHFDVARGKEGQEQVQGLWLYEIAELANFGKAEIGLIKAFVTAKVDRYRPSYGRTVEAYARQCLLVGTTNESTYLRDRTGNRRFWPIPVKNRIKLEWLRRWRELLFAEAYTLYTEGAVYTPHHQDEARLFVPMQESRLVETAVVSELWQILTRSPAPTGHAAVVNENTAFATISQLTQALGVDAAKSSPGLELQIRSWLDHEGWQRIKRQINGVRMWGYERPLNWPSRELDVPPATRPESGPDTPNLNGDADDAPF